MIDYAAARLNMVENQIRPNKVIDPAVLNAFLDVPRERFVPEELRGTAYIDEDLPLGGGRYLMEPMVLARLVQLAEIGPEDTVLLVGCATGYAAAIVARLARAVVAIEADHRFAATARTRLAELGCSAVTVIETPLAQGYPARAPYDVVLFDGAIGDVPAGIVSQLAEGGRMLAVVKAEEGMGKAERMTRVGGTLSRRVIFDAGTPLIPGLERSPSFVF